MSDLSNAIATLFVYLAVYFIWGWTGVLILSCVAFVPILLIVALFIYVAVTDRR